MTTFNIEFNCTDKEIKQLFASIVLQALHDYQYYLEQIRCCKYINHDFNKNYKELKFIHKYVNSEWFDTTSLLIDKKIFKKKLKQIEKDILGMSLKEYTNILLEHSKL